MNLPPNVKTALLIVAVTVLGVLNFAQWHEGAILKERLELLDERQDLANQHLTLLYRYCGTVERIGSAYHKTLTYTLEGLGVRRGPAHELVYIQGQTAIGGFDDGGTDISGP